MLSGKPKVMLGLTEVQYGESQIERPGIVVGHGTIWGKGGKMKGLTVQLYARGRTGRQVNFDSQIYLNALDGDRFEVHTGGAGKSIITLAEWQAFVDTVDVRVSEVSKNTVKFTPALIKMARDVVAKRRTAPTDAEWAKECGSEPTKTEAHPKVAGHAVKAFVTTTTTISIDFKEDRVLSDEDCETIYECLTVRSGGMFGEEYHVAKAVKKVAAQPQDLQDNHDVNALLAQTAKTMSLPNSEQRAVAEKRTELREQAKDVDALFKATQKAVQNWQKKDHLSRTLPDGYKLHQNSAGDVILTHESHPCRVVLAVYFRKDDRLDYIARREDIRDLMVKVAEGYKATEHPALASLNVVAEGAA